MEKIVTWILVADHQHAEFFENDGPNRGIRKMDDLSFDTHLHANQDIVSDRPGRSVSANDGRRHGFQPTSDPHRQEGIAFIERFSDVVAKSIDDYDRLIVIAPPRALGELRQTLSDSLRTKVVAELAKDMTKASPDDILAHLAPYLAA